MKEIKVCPSCHHQNNPARPSCSECGQSLRHAKTEYLSAKDETSAVPQPNDGREQPKPDCPDPAEPSSMANRAGTSGQLCSCPSPLPSVECPAVCDRCGNNIDSGNSTKSATISGGANQQEVIINGLEIDITEGVVLGRDPVAGDPMIGGIIANHTGVSRRHLWMMGTGDELLLLDLGSRNGTWLAEERLIPFKLRRISTRKLPVFMWLGGKIRLRIESGKR